MGAEAEKGNFASYNQWDSNVKFDFFDGPTVFTHGTVPDFFPVV